MTGKAPERLIARHEAFLDRLPAERPLVGQWIGGYFPSEQFPRGTSRWHEGAALRPQDVSFASFADDYEELHRAHQEADDDFFYVGSAYWGIPWLEAMLGCRVQVAAANCRAEPCLSSLDDVDGLVANLEANPWLDSLLGFTRDLVEFSAGRFPVCAPLLRGPGDLACAMLGGMTFATGFLDQPESMRRLLDHCTRMRMEVLRRLDAVIPSWQGTHAAGGYPSKVWCRRTVAYHQEDSAALVNPTIFRDFLLPLASRMCQLAEVNFIHLHSACLYPVDILVKDRSFDVLELNVDRAGVGPPLPKLLGTLKSVQAAGQPLVLWGEFSPDDWALIRRELSPAGLSVQPIVQRGDIRRRWE